MLLPSGERVLKRVDKCIEICIEEIRAIINP